MKRLTTKSQDKTLTQVGVHLSVILSYFWKACVLFALLFLLYSISLFYLFFQIAVKTLRSVQHFSWPEFTSASVALSPQPEVQSDRDDYQVSQSPDQHFLYRS